jgi:hypothetical protein
MKKDGTYSISSKIYYYEKVGREKADRLSRKAGGEWRNNYSKDIYHGTSQSFALCYKSYMVPLIEDGYIIETTNGAYTMHSNLLSNMLEELPELIEKHEIKKILNGIEALTYAKN